MDTQIWTMGHGLIPIDRLLVMLKQQRIEAVADVRTVPFSNRAPQFDRLALETSLDLAGIRYRFFGRELGGRPVGEQYYDASGHVLYRLVAQSSRFIQGMDLLMRGAQQRRTVVLCSESDPSKCHRNLLIGRVARQRGAKVTHVFHDGSTKLFDDDLVTQTGLPGMEEEDLWRSLVQVRPAPQLKSFLTD